MASISIYSAHKVFYSLKRDSDEHNLPCSAQGSRGSYGTVLVSKWDNAGKSVWVWFLVGKAYFFFHVSREESLSKGPFILGLEPLAIRNICIYTNKNRKNSNHWWPSHFTSLFSFILVELVMNSSTHDNGFLNEWLTCRKCTDLTESGMESKARKVIVMRDKLWDELGRMGRSQVRVVRF